MPPESDMTSSESPTSVPGGEVVVYEAQDGEVRVDVRLEQETVWLSQRDMAEVFDTTPENVLMHLRNVFSSGELNAEATTKEFLVVRTEGRRQVRRRIRHYNLDAIISVGYRVNSRRGVRFRQWATSPLRDHLVRGFTLNERRLAERGLREARETLDLLSRTLLNQELVDETGQAVLDLIGSYADTWRLLLEYDEDRLTTPPGAKPSTSALDHDRVVDAIAELKRELMARGEASPLFGNPRGDALAAILGNIEQTMFGEPLYRSREEKAAHLLYIRREGPSLHRRQQAYRLAAVPAVPEPGRRDAPAQPPGPDRAHPADRRERVERQGLDGSPRRQSPGGMGWVNAFTETVVEHAALDWFRALGYDVVGGPDMPPGPHALRESYADTIFPSVVRGALARLNPNLPTDALDDAFRKLAHPEGSTLAARNRAFHRMAVDGVTVEYRDDGGAIRGAQVQVLDFEQPANNDWLAVNQFTVVEGNHERRPDIVLFLNGLPLAVIELKNPADEDATVRSAWQQLRTYQAELPSLFTFNAVLAVSDGVEARLGTLTAGWEWFKPWRTISGEELAPVFLTELQVAIEGAFEKRRFLALLRDFIVFEDDGGGRLAKKMAGYHQFHAVETAVRETLRAAELKRAADDVAEVPGRYESGRKPGGGPGDRRIGVVWHTQGSGKSLTMAFYAGRIIREPAMANPTVVVLTDRNDLDDQLFGTFARCRDLLRQPPVQATTRDESRSS